MLDEAKEFEMHTMHAPHGTGPLPQADRKAVARKPGLEILELKEDFIKFVLSDTDISMANSLRRVLIAEVPTICIDMVEIDENSSVLLDEIIAHRLGLLPLVSSDVEQMKYRRECDCQDGCEQCQVEMSLDITNSNDEPLLVTAADLVVTERPPHQMQLDVRPVVDQGGRDADVNRDVVLVKLGKNQQLTFTAKARKGIGKEHSKWSPVAVATFAYDPDVRINERLMDTLDETSKRGFVESCPAKVYAYDAPTRTVAIEDAARCMYCHECVNKAESLGHTNLVSIAPKPGRFIFSVEGTGALNVESIVRTALAVLVKKLELIDSEVHIEILQDQHRPSAAAAAAADGY